MARTRKGKKSATAVKVDFTGVESSGNVAEGRQALEVVECEVKTSENTGNDYINWKFKAKGGTVYHTTSLQPQALWNLRNVLEAMGMEVPEGALELDLSEFPGMELGAEIEHEKYQGKKKPVIIDVFPLNELDEEESEEEGEEEEEAEELTADDLLEMDKDDLEELAEEEGIKVPAKHGKTQKKLAEFLIDKLGLEAEEEEEEEPEEEEAPRKSRRKKGTKTLSKGASVTFEDDGEDLEGTIMSINQKEGFAVVDVDGEEWEVELDDIQLA